MFPVIGGDPNEVDAGCIGLCHAARKQFNALRVTLLQISSSHLDFGHVVVVKELILSIIPCDPHARPVAGCDGTLIGLAVMPCYALADFELFGLVGFHARCYVIRAQG
jgi:hypothetical protein